MAGDNFDEFYKDLKETEKADSKLTPKQQAGLRRIGVEITDKAFAAAAEINAKSLEKLKKTIKVNSVDTSGFAKKAAPVFDQFKSDIGEDFTLKNDRDISKC